MEITCVNYDYPNFTLCKDPETRIQIESVRTNILKQIRLVQKTNSKNGVWAPACPRHGFSYWEVFTSN